VQQLSTIADNFTVTFSPATLTGSTVPPITARVMFVDDSRRGSPASRTLFSRILYPSLDADILP
jgi:hypothetical protein